MVTQLIYDVSIRRLFFWAMPAMLFIQLAAVAQSNSQATVSDLNTKVILQELPLHISILYFDQSSKQLRPGVKTALDSIARVLFQQPTLMATITGYTDNIGKPELNRILARERAQAVEQYLKHRDVSKVQLTIRWEGPQSIQASQKSEASETISRRVVIQLYPKP
ncbi:OmpA family protein [Spirosoma gilvum]